MTRVSTFGNYNSALMNLMATQVRSQEAQERVSTQKVATDLTGFGRSSETLTALKATQSRLQGFIDTGESVAARLASQDLAFDRVAEGAGGARQAIAEALAAGRVDGLMLQLQSQFQISQDGLNAKHQGRYVFAGSNVGAAPVVAMTLADLSAAASVADAFQNDSLKQTSRLDEGTRLDTNFLANEIGSNLFQIFRDIQQYHETTPITGQPDQAMRDFLTTQLARLDTERASVTDMAARNGSMQNRVETILKAQGQQKTSLDELLSNKTDADMAQAVTELQMSQLAIQASAQVINQLRQVSLLNYLS
ncbi:flagellin [uncultured Brevundimonas sp.]|uniref:flagellin n=1 Tax=uncultured Brevundimonas sp. TaxID=213418 RepID=UPI0030ECCF4B|tara:strand:- start:38518 stop:39438 length:921 start_codon:yes stop_codon:yes gene_type:complete